VLFSGVYLGMLFRYLLVMRTSKLSCLFGIPGVAEVVQHEL